MLATLRRWWRSEHGTPGPKALLIELAVVIVGVFGAQQLSNWNAKRIELHGVERLHRDLLYSFAIYRDIARTHIAAVPCIAERVDLISKLASERREIDAELLEPASLLKMGPDDVSRESDRLLRERYGDFVADKIGSVEFNLLSSQQSSLDLEQTWFEFQRLNPAIGQVEGGDRDAARAAAVRIKGELFTLGKSAKLIVELTDLLGVKAREGGLQPVENCQQLWRPRREQADRRA